MVKEETVELSLENVTRRFGQKDAVAGVSAVLKPGVYGLLGANGAGKTTLMRMVCDVLRPTSGRIASGPPRRLQSMTARVFAARFRLLPRLHGDGFHALYGGAEGRAAS